MEKSIIALIVGIAVLSISYGTAYAQLGDASTSTYGQVLAFGSFVAAGVFYSASGWIQKIRRSLSGEKVALDWTKMGKSVILGLVLGVAAYAWSAYNGELISVNTFQEFMVQAGLHSSAILFVDKWLLGRSGTAKIEADSFPVDEAIDTDVPPEDVKPKTEAK